MDVILRSKLMKICTYKVQIEYRTVNTQSKCMKYNSALGRNTARSHEAEYYPNIEGSTHNLRVPLEYLKSDTACSWKPTLLSLCASHRKDEPTSCSSLYAFIGRQEIKSETTMECNKNGWCFKRDKTNKGYINEFNKEYILHVVEKRT
jgi:hypothetical protein